MRLFLSIIPICLLFLTSCGSSSEAHHSDKKNVTTVYLVRHCEKADLTADPVLSEAGEKRAVELSEVLGNVGIDYIHSTDFKRTRATAKPTAEAYGIEPEIYNATELPKLVEKIKSQKGTHLVVGHSTTTPKMVQLLGGDKGTSINEKGEFDRLYKVTIQANGDVSSELRSYGVPYTPKN